MMKLYAPFIREATLRVTMTLRSEGHGGDPSPKLQGGVCFRLRLPTHLRQPQQIRGRLHQAAGARLAGRLHALGDAS